MFYPDLTEPLRPWYRPDVRLAASVTRNAPQLITQDLLTVVVFDTVDYDTGDMVDLAGQPTRITITAEGIYLLTLQGRFAAPAGLTVDTFGARVDGTTIVATDEKASIAGAPAVSGAASKQLQLSIGQYVEMVVQQGDSGPLNLELASLQLTRLNRVLAGGP